MIMIQVVYDHYYYCYCIISIKVLYLSSEEKL